MNCYVLRERSAITRKQEIEMGRVRKGEEMRKGESDVQRGKRQDSKCCLRWPKMREIDPKAKWMDTKKDQKGKMEEKGGMKGEQRSKTGLKWA